MTVHVSSRVAACVAMLPLSLAGCGGNTESDSPSANASRPPVAQPVTRSAAPPAGAPVWHYDGAEGPDRWGSLSPTFSACGAGRSQSPIDISGSVRGVTAPLRARFPAAELRIAHHEHIADGINNGHTIQINYGGGDTLTLGSQAYELVQYHFHSPSEHTIGGKHLPMEMHLVHKSTDGQLAVVGVLIAAGGHNGAFDPVWSHLPTAKGIETHLQHVMVDVDALLPSVNTSYRYDGSLTTPPCSEGVKWAVMTTPIQLSQAQIDAFRALIHDNNRPVQPLNGRAVVTDAIAAASTGE